MTYKKAVAPRPMLTDPEIVAELRRAVIVALLRKNTWTSDDLRRVVTVGEVAEALVPGSAEGLA